ncbi:hypothetical protein, partial [Bacillus cereus group sp. BcHK28]|uniref:hypothetical protein n=1 Tax=Bacillus cereus group sp. BcHK28 TaxID=3018090 RepID=UPI0022E5C85F
VSKRLSVIFGEFKTVVIGYFTIVDYKYVYLSNKFPLNMKIYKNAQEFFILSIFMVIILFNS